MAIVTNFLLCAAVRFLRRDDGTATVEAVLWFPIFFGVFGLMVDAASIFHGQSRVLRVIQDANRNMSIGRFTQDTQVEDFIVARLGEFDVVPSSTNATSDGNVVLTVVDIPARQFQLIGLFGALVNLEITVTHGHILDSVDPSAFATMATPTV